MILPDAYRPRSDKACGFPLVVMSDSALISGHVQVSGFYISPEPGERLIGDRYYPADRGLIAAVDHSTVAHEWRHHWQWFMGWEYDGIGWPPGEPTYEANLARYYLESRSEQDALLHEHQQVPSDHYDTVLSAISLFATQKKMRHPRGKPNHRKELRDSMGTKITCTCSGKYRPWVYSMAHANRDGTVSASATCMLCGAMFTTETFLDDKNKNGVEAL